MIITVLLRLLCRVVNGLRIFRGFGGFHESLELLIELGGLMLLEYLDIAAVALVELHQLLVKAVLLFLLPLLELGWITWRLRRIFALLLTAGNAKRLPLILTLVWLISVVLSPLRLNGTGLLDGFALSCDSVLLLIGCCLISVE